MNRFKYNVRRIIAFFFVLITLFNATVVDVFAGDTVFLQSLIDISTNKYQVTPVGDSNKKNKKLEYKTAQINKYVFLMCDAGEAEGGDANKCYIQNKDYSGDEYKTGTANYDYGNFWMETELMYHNGNIYVDDSRIDEDLAKEIEKVNIGGSDKKLSSTVFFKSSGKADYLPLSWPSDPELHHASTDEVNYATNVASTLSNSLNQLIDLVNGGKKIKNTSELMAISVALRPSSGNTASFGNYILEYKFDGDNYSGSSDKSGNATEVIKKMDKDTKASDVDLDELPTYDENGNLYVYIYPAVKNGTTIVKSNEIGSAQKISAIIYAMPKGYRYTKGGLYKDRYMFSKSNRPYGDLDEVDSAWVNIHMLSQYANAVYKANGTTAGNVADADEGNWIINAIVNFFQRAVHGFLSLLGLKSTNELVYNRGLRGSSLFNFGTMSDNWWKVVLQYHLIFQALAWFVIVCGFLKTCIDLNLSRMNPNARENAYNSIKRFLVVGFLLVLIIPLSQFMMSMNNSIVQIFSSQVADVNSDIAPNVKGIAGIIFVFAYGVIRIYINFVYIMRSITIALLLVSAPFFISVGAWSKNGYHNSLTTQWFKELTANIFMQSVHAFCLAFLINLMGNGSGLESFVISYSIIPITEMFRGLIFQGAGSSTVNLGQQAADKGTKMAQSFAKSAGNVALSAGAKALSGDNSSAIEGKNGSGSGSGNKGAESGAAAMNNVMNNKVSELKSKIESGKGGAGAKAGIAALRGLQGAGKLAGAMAGFGTGMMNAELSGNSMGYSDAGAAAGSYVAGFAQEAADAHQDNQQRKNNQLSYGQKTSAKNSSIGSEYTNGISVNDKGIGKGGKSASAVNSAAADAMNKIKKGETLNENDRTSLAMRVAQNGTADIKDAETGKVTKMDAGAMKAATGFSNSSEAKEYLANMGMSVSGGKDNVSYDPDTGKEISRTDGSGYSYRTGNDNNGSIVKSKKLSSGAEAVCHAVPQSNGAVASNGPGGSVNVSFGKTSDGVNGFQNFEAFAKRDVGAAGMLSEINAQRANGNATSGQLSNGINWSLNSSTGAFNLNYGDAYQKINGIQQMAVSDNGKFVNAVQPNRNVSSLYTSSIANASTPLRPQTNPQQAVTPNQDQNNPN